MKRQIAGLGLERQINNHKRRQARCRQAAKRAFALLRKGSMRAMKRTEIKDRRSGQVTKGKVRPPMKTMFEEPPVIVTPEKPSIGKDTLAERFREDVKYEVLWDKRVDFTMELAQRFIEMPQFIGERDLIDAHVEHLIGEAKRGTFIFENASLASCECRWDGIERRLNGHHTSWMRTFLPPNKDVKIRWVKFAVDTEDDFRRMYATFDRNRGRTNAHIVNVRLFGTNEFQGINKTLLKLLAQGFKVWNFGGNDRNKTRINIDEMATEMAGKHLGLTRSVAELMEHLGIGRNKDKVHLKRASVFGALFETVQRSATASKEFWTMVGDGVGVENVRDPRHKLREFLMRTGVDFGRGVSSGKKTVGAEELYSVIISLWNKWRDGDEVQVVQIPRKRMRAK